MSNRFSKLRQKAIDQSREELLLYGRRYQSEIIRALEDSFLPKLDVNQDGSIRATAKNTAKVATVDELMNRIARKRGSDLIDWYVKQLDKLARYSRGYFDLIEPGKKTQTQRAVQRSLRHLYNRIGYDGERATRGGFLYDMTRANDPTRKIKAQAFRAISTGQGFTDFQSQLRVFIQGPGRQGIYETHFRTTAYDSFQQFDRQINNQVADQLGMNYARYAGGEMDTSRDFCLARTGKIFSREEIEAWSGITWQGKTTPYDPFLDLGGYNCTHTLDWVPDRVAEREREREG